MVLLWLLPTLAVTLAAMVWVSWAGREGRGEVDREVALRRMARVLEPSTRRGPLGRRPRRAPPSYVVQRPRERSTGIAMRPSRPSGETRTSAPGQRPEERRAS